MCYTCAPILCWMFGEMQNYHLVLFPVFCILFKCTILLSCILPETWFFFAPFFSGWNDDGDGPDVLMMVLIVLKCFFCHCRTLLVTLRTRSRTRLQNTVKIQLTERGNIHCFKEKPHKSFYDTAFIFSHRKTPFLLSFCTFDELSSHSQLEAEVCGLRVDLRRSGWALPHRPWWDNVSVDTKARGKT